MKYTVALTGASGNMGRETLRELMQSPVVDKVKILCLNTSEDRKFVKAQKKIYRARLEASFGDLAVLDDCEKLVDGANYLLHLALLLLYLYIQNIRTGTLPHSADKGSSETGCKSRASQRAFP